MTHGARRVAIVGPTAAGKSALALQVARRVASRSANKEGGSPVELVSLDSMQVYRLMSIGTAKATAAEQREIPHHGLDLVDPWDEFTLGEFLRETRAAEAAVGARGAAALLVGGSGLHHRAVVDGFDPPGQWPEVRAELETELEAAGPAGSESRRVVQERIWHQLAALDPVAVAKIESTNERRTVRALEVARGSGRPFSSFGADMTEYSQPGVPMVGLDLDRSDLDAAIATRVQRQLREGWVEEVASIASAAQERGVPPYSRTAAQAIGYVELLAVVSGRLALADAVETIVVKTRRFARRQQRWFRRDPRITWFEARNISSAAEWLLRNLAL